jgi:glycosyltransferase involved in cell wall biosynthesis
MKLLFVVTEDWYFHSHRLPMARAAQKAGFEVAVATNVKACRAAIEAEGITVHPLSLDRGSLNPFSGLRQIARLAALYRREKPDVVHHIAMKPVLFGSIAAWREAVPCVINAFAGLGFLFASDRPLAKMLRPVLIPLFRLVLKRGGNILLLQNPDDRALLERLNLAPEGRTFVIRGSGVDLDAYKSSLLPALRSEFICIYAGRMIDIKGLGTLQAAFAALADTHPHIKLWLCGEPDAANPGSWTQDRLRAWSLQPNIVYKGRSRMTEIWPQAHLALQPSWGGEGVPKSLLEAAACGRPILASDVPGCREVVRPNENGLLIPPKDAAALAAAILMLAEDPERLQAMAGRSRAIVSGDLSASGVAAQAERLYRLCRQEPDETQRIH